MIQAASASFEITEQAGAPSFNTTSAAIETVHGPLRTTVTLLSSGSDRVCLIAPNLFTHTHLLYREILHVVQKETGLKKDRVLVASSHNHTGSQLSDEPVQAFWSEGPQRGKIKLTKSGRQFFDGLARTVRTLPGKLRPIAVSWAMGREGRISYNNKGRRADGSTYFMREDDRLNVGKDYRGDIDEEAPVVCLTGLDGNIQSFITQFTAHPTTAYHPEHPIVFGEYPQVACDVLADHYRRQNPEVEVLFLQGCAGDTNSKGLLTGDVARARRFGRMLGRTYVRASRQMQSSVSACLALRRTIAHVPFGPLPSLKTLEKEKAEIDSFITRARRGDEDTLLCAGLNFPKNLSTEFRAVNGEIIRKWTTWAIAQRRSGKADQLPHHLDMEVCVLRIGDVAIVGMPCEPFVGVGRRIRAGSAAPLTIPCGYFNTSYGYVPDGPNVGDSEFMSAFYRYTRRPPYRKPGGDVLASVALREIKHLFHRDGE